MISTLKYTGTKSEDDILSTYSPSTRKKASKWFRATLTKKRSKKSIIDKEEKEENESNESNESSGSSGRRNSLPHDASNTVLEDSDKEKPNDEVPLSARLTKASRSSTKILSRSESSAQQKREFRRSASVANNRAHSIIIRRKH